MAATHHVPSFLLTDPLFKTDFRSGSFAVELADFIEDSRIECWIYGHVHRNIDAAIGKTRCVSNPLGYVKHGEHLTFDPARAIEIW